MADQNNNKRTILHVFSVFMTPKTFFGEQFRFLSDLGYDIRVCCSFNNEAYDFAKNNHVSFFPLDIKRKLSPIKDLKAVIRLCRYIKNEKIEVVVGHTPKGALLSMIAAWLMRVRSRVYYRHGLIFTTAKGIKRKILVTEERFVSSLATIIINVSPSVAELAVQEGLGKATKQTIIGKGTCGGIDAHNLFNPELVNDTKAYLVREKFEINAKTIVLGFCGRICNDKGVRELVAGFDMFREAFPNRSAKLLLIGSFDDRDVLPLQLKNKIENDVDIQVTGFIEKKELPVYYSVLDVFVFPSYREGFGMSVIEASAMEKPVLVSRSHGCVDSIIENETGFYIETSPQGVFTGLEMMLDENVRQRLGKAGRKMVLDYYDYKVLWPIIANLYQTLCRN